MPHAGCANKETRCSQFGSSNATCRGRLTFSKRSSMYLIPFDCAPSQGNHNHCNRLPATVSTQQFLFSFRKTQAVAVAVHLSAAAVSSNGVLNVMKWILAIVFALVVCSSSSAQQCSNGVCVGPDGYCYAQPVSITYSAPQCANGVCSVAAAPATATTRVQYAAPRQRVFASRPLRSGRVRGFLGRLFGGCR